MYKILLLVSLTALMKMDARCQSRAFATNIEYLKTQQSGAGIQLPYATSTVEDALKEYMTVKGYKPVDSKGWIVCRGVRLESSDTALSDLYFNPRHKSRKDKDITLITLLPAKKNEDMLTRSGTDSAQITRACSFLDSMAPYIEAYHLQLQVTSQTEVVKKAEKKMNSLLSDQTSLDKKIRKWQEDSTENKKDQVRTAADLQANINADDATKTKNNKRLRKLMDEEGDLAKKLRDTRARQQDNKRDQEAQQQELDKQRLSLEAVKARQQP